LVGSTSTLGAPDLPLSARRVDQAKWCLMRLRCALVVMVAAWVVAACTSPHRTASRPVTKAQSASTAPPSSSAEPTPTTTGIEPTTSIKPKLGADLPRCHTSQVTARVGRGFVAAGNALGVYVLQNTSATTCRLFGYPGLQMLDSNHRPVPTTVMRGGAYMFPAQAPSRVIVPPGGVASFSVGYREVASGEEPPSVQCMPFSYVEITPPDERQPLLLSSGGAPCGHRAMISPVVTGEDGVHYG